jgi:lipopolysaccharide heptosyltransferase III
VIESAPEKWMPDWSQVRKALLIRLRSIGDTVLMTPCLEALKSWKPAIEITVLSEPLSAPVLEAHPSVDNLIICDKSLYSRAKLISRLRREKFDAAFNLHGGSTATMLARLSGAKRSIGYGDYRLSWMLDARAPAPDRILGRSRLHSVEQQLALIHWSGMPWPSTRPKLRLATSKQAEVAARKRLDSENLKSFALIAPAAAFESKRWRADGFARVADHLSERWNLPSVITAGPGQEALAQEVAALSTSKARVIVGLSLKELIALTGLAQVFVGNDSGPMHIAAALGRPLAAVFGSSDTRVWHPWTDSPHRVIECRTSGAEGRIKIKDTNIADSTSEAGFAIRRIPVNDVTAAVDEVLQSALAVGS